MSYGTRTWRARRCVALAVRHMAGIMVAPCGSMARKHGAHDVFMGLSHDAYDDMRRYRMARNTLYNITTSFAGNYMPLPMCKHHSQAIREVGL